MPKAEFWTAGYTPDAADLHGLYPYRFETAGGLVIDCYLEHTAAEEATDVAPGARESMSLTWACVAYIDISEVIQDLAPVIEAEALEDLQAAAKREADEPVDHTAALLHYTRLAEMACAA